jgi:uracil-DNA glycosylase
VASCRACPRLVEWRERVGREKRRAFAGDEYWARPITGFGDPAAPVMILGLAPAAHGGNRTGRVFTGDRSADFLVAAMHRAGLASQPNSDHVGDGLRLIGCRMTAAVRCAPPGNAPTPDERRACAGFLETEILLTRPRVIVALGGFAWDAGLRALAALGHAVPRPRPRFAHGAEVRIGDVDLLGTYHPSQQNTFTGRLTPPMLDAVLERARLRAGQATAANAGG